jgi:hypothetical protein
MLPAEYFDKLMSEKPPQNKNMDELLKWYRISSYPKSANDYPLPESAGREWEKLDFAAMEIRLAERAVAMGIDWASDVSRSRTVSYVGQGDKAPNCRCVVGDGSLTYRYEPKPRLQMIITPITGTLGSWRIEIQELDPGLRSVSVIAKIGDLQKEIDRLLDLSNNLTSFVW